MPAGRGCDVAWPQARGSGVGSNDPRVYNADGTLRSSSVVRANLRRRLEGSDRGGTALLVQLWYFRRDRNVRDDTGALAITGRVAAWLRSTGYRHDLLGVVNELGHGGYGRRPLFTTSEGALQIVDAVRKQDSGVSLGISPRPA